MITITLGKNSVPGGVENLDEYFTHGSGGGAVQLRLTIPCNVHFRQEAHLVVLAGKGRWRGGGGRREASRFLIGFSSLFACPICFQKALFCSNPFFLHPSSLAG